MSTSVDAILQRLIVDAQNMNPDLVGRITQGTDTYIRFASVASAIWGLYKQLDWTVDQIFPESMSKASLEKFCRERNKNVDDMTAADMLSFVLSYLRQPPSGGKGSDYERWALEATSSGAVLTVDASMLSASSSALALDSTALLTPKDKSSVGFQVNTGDVGQYIVVDFGSAVDVIGVGLGFTTARGAEFRVYSSDDAAEWTLRSVLSATGWAMDTFTEASAQYWKIELAAIDNLESWQIQALNAVKCHGLEFYKASETAEKALYAKSIKNAYGKGTMAILLAPVTLSMRLLESVRAYCEEEGPVAPREIYVSVQKESTVDIRIVIQGFSSMDETAFRSDVQKYFAGLKAGDIVVAAQLVVFAIQHGAINATPYMSVDGGAETDTPTLEPAPDQKFKLGTLTVE